jgi:hypothetical protein
MHLRRTSVRYISARVCIDPGGIGMAPSLVCMFSKNFSKKKKTEKRQEA